MERLGGGPHQRGPMTTLAAASIHSTTLRDSFLASDIADRNHRSHSDIARTSSFAGLTLEAVLNIDRSRSSPTNHGDAATSSSSGNTENNSAIVRTLLDILQNEQALIPSSTNLPGKKTWKSLKDRLKLRRLPVITGPFSSSNPVFSWTASQPVSRSSLEVQGQGQMMSDQDSIQDVPRSSEIRQTGSSGNDTVPAGDRLTIDSSGRAESGGGGSMRLAAALAAEREETRRRLPMQLGVAGTDGEMNEGRGHTGSDQRCSSVNEREGNPSGSGGGGEPVRMSLMDLLEETDGHGGIQDQTYQFDPVDVEQDEEAEQRAGGKEGVGEVPCCVCLVRHKGAAFIPCGHTFCRLCSRELWVQRGHCPLCNNFIVEILDIF